MSNNLRRFEIAILRPMWGATILLAGISLLSRWWWSLGGCCAALFYLGTIGSKLHPLQSGHDLSAGPTKSPGAVREATILTTSDQLLLVTDASIRVAVLIGISTFAFLVGVKHWRWYWDILVSLVVTVNIASVLRAIFVLRATT
jgi:hypothetical protein